MKKVILLLFFTAISLFQSLNAQLNFNFVGSLEYQGVEANDIWGYVDDDGVEYALVGLQNGVSIVSLADPSNPEELFFVPGAFTTWRDLKTWKGFAYVTNEGGNGLLVIDLTDLPNSADYFNWNPQLLGLGPLNTIHNIYIDEGIAYLAGANVNEGGVLYIDVDSEPGTPKFVGNGPAIYSHDVYVRDNIMYSSEIYEGVFSAYDVTNKSNTLYLGSAGTGGEFTHNSWLSDDGNILFTTDEVPNGPVGAYDVSDPTDIKELDQFLPYETLGEGVIPHNVHVWNDYIIISYYTDGCIIVDGSRPSNLVEVGNFDTFIPPSTGFSGAWGAYPYLPSGLVIVSDIESGLYILEPNYVRACWLEGNISDAETGTPIQSAEIDLLDTNVFDSSFFNGDYAIGYATSGTYQVEVSKFGYEPKVVDAVLENGEITILDIELEPLPSITFSGTVFDSQSGLLVPNANLIFKVDEGQFETDSDEFGNFFLPTVYPGTYEVFVGKWGYKSSQALILEITAEDNVKILEVEPGYEDPFNFDFGWESTGDAESGYWEFGEPIPFSPGGGGGSITPPVDVDEDIGNSCYVTGNEADFDGFVSGGEVSLKSPKFDIEDYEAAKLSFYYWYLNGSFGGNSDPSLSLDAIISNGNDEYVVSLSEDTLGGGLSWKYVEVDLDSIITVSDDMTITFKTSVGGQFIAEAAIDYFRVWDSAEPVDPETSLEELNGLVLNISPNPSNNSFVINYSIENSQYTVMNIYDALGKLVDSQKLNNDQGEIRYGEQLSSGIYMVQIVDGFNRSKTYKIIKQ